MLRVVRVYQGENLTPLESHCREKLSSAAIPTRNIHDRDVFYRYANYVDVVTNFLGFIYNYSYGKYEAIDVFVYIYNKAYLVYPQK